MWFSIFFLGIFVAAGITSTGESSQVKPAIDRRPRQTSEPKTKKLSPEPANAGDTARIPMSDDYMTFAGSEEGGMKGGYDALSDPELDFNVDEYDFDFVQDEYSARGRPFPKTRISKPKPKEESRTEDKRPKSKENGSKAVAPRAHSKKPASDETPKATSSVTGSGNARAS